MKTEMEIVVSDSVGKVPALLERPENARWLLVLAHGAGAGMHHSFMEALATELANAGIATLRYNFPYIQRRGRPDPPAVLTATVRAAIAAAAHAAPDLPLLAGGKSLGGRMTSHVLADRKHFDSVPAIAHVVGLVFFGFPLHAPGRPDTKRAAHLNEIRVPMLFLQGTRDSLADLSLLRPLCAQLGSLATLHIIDTADHSFHVLKSSGKTDAAVLQELAQTTATWADSVSGTRHKKE